MGENKEIKKRGYCIEPNKNLSMPLYLRISFYRFRGTHVRKVQQHSLVNNTCNRRVVILITNKTKISGNLKELL